MTVVVTGGAGFIGSNLVHRLGRDGIDVVVVDDPTNAAKLRNLDGAPIADHIHRRAFREALAAPGAGTALDGVTAVIHQGARTRTDERDTAFLADNNFAFSVELLSACSERSIPFIYASSAAVYGRNRPMVEDPRHERPLNPYAVQKLRFDEHVRSVLPLAGSQIVGLRYFNVYGPREAHKGTMASMVSQMTWAIAAGRPAVLFGAGHGVGPGEHRRDFVHVDDVIDVIGWFLDHRDRSGIFNCGTGRSERFIDVANAIIGAHGGGSVEFCPMPADVATWYQPHSEADLTALRAVGYDGAFRSVAAGAAELVHGRAASAAP